MNPETDTGVVILSGCCGDELTFELRDTGNLYISGKGEMYDYTSGTAPWCSYAAENKMRVAFDSGATYIGEYAFANCYSLKYVSLFIQSIVGHLACFLQKNDILIFQESGTAT